MDLGGIFSGLVSILAGLLQWKNRQAESKNSPEHKAREKNHDDAQANDRVADLTRKAAAGDQKSLEQLRREASE